MGHLKTLELSPREELLQLQKKVFHRNDRIIRNEALVEEPGFTAYERRYRKYVVDFEKVSDVEAVLSAVEAADIIYIGDYHTNPQSQRTLLRLLKLLTGRVQDMGLALELVQDQYQTHLDKFLAGRLSEAGFLRKIQFKNYWYFDLWDNFKAVFDFARYHHIPVFGIESAEAHDKGLKSRDQQSGRLVASLIERFPNRKFFVFVGDLHIAPPHLPAQVDRALAKKQLERKRLMLYQNSENIYWKLAEQQKEEKAEIVQVDSESFCFMNTPPIVWQQTFLNWLENEGDTIDYVDAKYTVLEYLERLADFLDISLPKDCDEVEVYTCGDLSFLEVLRSEGSFSTGELKTIKRQILSSESYFIPRIRTIYLANVSMNHASEEASHYLKYLCSREEKPRLLSDAFYMNALHEAMGFFGSKVINHKRKSVREHELKDLATYLNSIHLPTARRIELEIARLVLEHRRMERRKTPVPLKEAMPYKTEVFLGATHLLGYMLGDRLYHGLMNDFVSKSEVRKLFEDSLEHEGEPFEAYIKLVQQTKDVKLPRRL